MDLAAGRRPAGKGPLAFFFFAKVMLRDRLYRIQGHEGKEAEHRFQIELDPNDPIFEGHFPDQPVLPAVCLMEIGRELLREIRDVPWQLVKAKNMKIPSMVDPRQTPKLIFDMSFSEEAEGLRTKYTVTDREGTVCFKFSGLFREAES